jgi:hypothetical protein
LRRRGAICIRQEPLTRSAASAMPPTAPAGAVRPDIELRGSNPMRASAYATRGRLPARPTTARSPATCRLKGSAAGPVKTRAGGRT